MTNKILALKYRPQEFKDLIGQEVMAQTITNAIKLPKSWGLYFKANILLSIIIKEAGNNLNSFHYGCFFSDLTGFMKHPPDANLIMIISR